MRKASIASIATVALIGLGSSASAAFVVGAPVVVTSDNTQVSIEFMGSSAGHTGQLYFLGSGASPLLIDSPALDSDSAGLGQFLFNNHTSIVGATMTLDGLFSAGDILHFAYDVIAPSPVANRLYRSDSMGDQGHFGFDLVTGDLRVEDLPLASSDLDYNDAMFQLTFTPIPAPGALALAAVAGVSRRGRSRREN